MTNGQEHVWTPQGTDIQERWRAQFGWVPPSEDKKYQEKWAFYQNLPMRKLEDIPARIRLSAQ